MTIKNQLTPEEIAEGPPENFPPRGFQLVPPEKILDAIVDYTIIATATLDNGKIALHLQATELPDITLIVDAYTWIAAVDDA